MIKYVKKEVVKDMKVGIYTLGCKVNAYESEYILSLFKEKGYTICDIESNPDICIINTCTVTNNSDKKDKKMINHIKNNNKNSIIIVCGCFVESNKDYNFDGVDIIIGNYNKSKIVELTEKFIEERKQIIEKENIMRVPFEDMMIKSFPSRTRAYVKIQDGCENYCSYCVIPFVRGRCRSKDKDKVLEEIKNLTDNGYKEIVLTGIHTGSYGIDLNIKFSSLLEEILENKDLKHLRISSIEITELDDKFFCLLKNEVLCNHLHIPLQSGSKNVLKNMNRKYTKEEFLDMVNKIRSVRPDISLTTDLIVGFPGETKEDFEETLEFLKLINFSKIHVFPYSKRNGTKAFRMENQIDEKTKKERVKEVLKLSDRSEREYFNKFIGKTLEVLIEKYEDGYSYGHTSNYLYLKINKKLNHNELYNIKIEEDMF